MRKKVEDSSEQELLEAAFALAEIGGGGGG
jgi:hypothetical protein